MCGRIESVELSRFHDRTFDGSARITFESAHATKVAIARMPIFSQRNWGSVPVNLNTTIIGAKLNKTVEAAQVGVRRIATIWLKLR